MICFPILPFKFLFSIITDSLIDDAEFSRHFPDIFLDKYCKINDGSVFFALKQDGTVKL